MRRIALSFILILPFLLGSYTHAQASKISFWHSPRKGANWFNEVPTKDWLIAARRAGIMVVRIAPNSWQSQQRDFLIGDADRYIRGLQERCGTLVLIGRLGVALGQRGAEMLFMVIERFKNRDAVSVYRRYRAHGRMMPEGLRYVESWVEHNFRPVLSIDGM